MKKKMKRRGLTRWADALLPLALLTASAQGYAMECLYVTLCTLGSRLCALATARSVRAAFAEQPSMRDVRGSVQCALAMQPPGAAILLGLLALIRPEWAGVRGALITAAGLLLNLEQVFYEYLYSAGDGGSAGMSRLITAALLYAGILLSDQQAWRITAAAGIACLASAAVSLTVGGGLKGRRNAGPIRSAPRFLLQEVLYPAVFTGLVLWNPRDLFARTGVSAVSFFAGLTLYSLCRTAFRRSALESRPMNLVLLLTCLASILLGAAALLLTLPAGLPSILHSAWSALPAAASALLAAAVCAFALFGSLRHEV